MEQLAPYYNSDSLQLGRPHEKTMKYENKHEHSRIFRTCFVTR